MRQRRADGALSGETVVSDPAFGTDAVAALAWNSSRAGASA